MPKPQIYTCCQSCSPCVTICLGGGGQGSTGPPGPTGPQGPTGPSSLEGPFPNNIHVCLRPGESTEINLAQYTVPGTYPIDASSYAIEQYPFFDAGLTVSLPGVVQYTANTRFLGSDYFTFSVMDTMGNQSPTFGTVFISVQCLKPQPILPATFLYSHSSAKIVYEYNSLDGSTELFEDTDGNHTGPLTSLATNREDGLIYYVATMDGTGTLFAYDYVNALFVTITMPDGMTPVTGTSLGLGTGDIKNGGATFTNGVLFLGVDGTNYVRIPMDRYIPGSMEQSITDSTIVTIGTSPLITYGDMAYDPISSSLIIINNSVSEYVVNPIGGTLYYTVPSSATNIALGPDNVFYTSVGTAVRRYNVYTGAVTPVADAQALVSAPAAMTDYICHGCPLGESTTVP